MMKKLMFSKSQLLKIYPALNKVQ